MKVPDWIRHSNGFGGIERIEAFFQGHGYDMHRHDTYAIGITLGGVQSFRYRRARRDSLPGQTIVLHPDEPHDGEAGTDDGFMYRMVYVAPALLQQALGNQPLPFVPGGISDDPRLHAAVAAMLADDSRADPLAQDDALFDLATALSAAAGTPARQQKGDFAAAQKAREFIHQTLDRPLTLDELARVSGRDRWSLSREFRRYFGTSPYRYLTLRRLDRVRQMMRCGDSLADCAASAGFADQSHMTRQFAQAFGVSPARWLKTVDAGDTGTHPTRTIVQDR
ncbi:AraC family transcriptional regulator [Paraburkholderia sp.]|uniref:AraC family transcriptional regulator n=1 Tax=Paraburkholderia sp. TaxID=1926495 RepID=UPI00239D541F|nr:AraC family transcriptional regulator [Paraburkholderia sp.]MDE1184794.1 AraC family transcriptional regulator [Paraburkholderia sp.]